MTSTDADLATRVARLEDLEAIRALDARYCRLLDDADIEGLLDLFTADGEFVGLEQVTGRAALREFFTGLPRSGLTAFWHHVTNLEITLDGPTEPHGHARATSLLWQPCVHAGQPHIAAGRYRDTLIRDPDAQPHSDHGGWRYQRKQVSFDYFTPLRHGWEPGRFALPAAAATYRSATTATERP